MKKYTLLIVLILKLNFTGFAQDWGLDCNEPFTVSWFNELLAMSDSLRLSRDSTFWSPTLAHINYSRNRVFVEYLNPNEDGFELKFTSGDILIEINNFEDWKSYTHYGVVYDLLILNLDKKVIRFKIEPEQGITSEVYPPLTPTGELIERLRDDMLLIDKYPGKTILVSTINNCNIETFLLSPTSTSLKSILSELNHD